MGKVKAIDGSETSSARQRKAGIVRTLRAECPSHAFTACASCVAFLCARELRMTACSLAVRARLIRAHTSAGVRFTSWLKLRCERGSEPGSCLRNRRRTRH